MVLLVFLRTSLVVLFAYRQSSILVPFILQSISHNSLTQSITFSLHSTSASKILSYVSLFTKFARGKCFSHNRNSKSSSLNTIHPPHSVKYESSSTSSGVSGGYNESSLLCAVLLRLVLIHSFFF